MSVTRPCPVRGDVRSLDGEIAENSPTRCFAEVLSEIKLESYLAGWRLKTRSKGIRTLGRIRCIFEVSNPTQSREKARGAVCNTVEFGSATHGLTGDNSAPLNSELAVLSLPKGWQKKLSYHFSESNKKSEENRPFWAGDQCKAHSDELLSASLDSTELEQFQKKLKAEKKN